MKNNQEEINKEECEREERGERIEERGQIGIG